MDLDLGLTAIDGSDVVIDLIAGYGDFPTIKAGLVSLTTDVERGMALKKLSNGSYSLLTVAADINSGTSTIDAIALTEVASDATNPSVTAAVKGTFLSGQLKPTGINAGS
jgi:hypothetical protein